MNKGDAVSILGASSAGKSTLLALRAGAIGFVFQSFHLIAGMTALENVSLPLELTGDNATTSADQDAMALLDSVGIAVTALTAVAFFTDRVDTALSHQGAKLLAADLVIEHGDPPRTEFIVEAEKRGLKTVRILEFPSVLFYGEKPILVQVKGIGPGYPLRGKLRLAGKPAQDVPLPGEAWVEKRLLSLLRTELNERVDFGKQSVKITDIVDQEPDRGGQLIRIASRIMLSLDTIDQTGLLGPARAA